ncbi:MAG: DNA repair protein RecN [Anaerolineaceae bacterium]|nr:DNA repair protein RecN [Anaerolineaceae bacterium]
MLTELRIENFAIIQNLELKFGSGLIAFTGETGAGKSIILDAIVALVGGKTDATMVRGGSDRASLEAEFQLSKENKDAVVHLLEAEGLMDDPNSITLGREIRKEGRTIARINGRSVNVNLLKEVGSYLVDIHGQSEHLSLLNPRQHINLLDRFIDLGADLEAYRAIYRELQGVRRELVKLRQTEQDAARKTDLLNYQVQEIESAQLQSGEEEQLRQERTRLANAEALASFAQQALAVLDDGGPEAMPVSDLIGKVVLSVSQLARLDPSQNEMLEQVESLEEMISDLARNLREYQDEIEYNPRRLEQIEDRLEVYHSITRKYGATVDIVLAFANDARQQLELISHASERIEELEKREKALLIRLTENALKLAEKRRSAAIALEKGVEQELDDLSMAGAKFKVDFQRLGGENRVDLPDGTSSGFDENGIDAIEFLIAPNMGEGLKPLVKIASGGETSRLMLALKNVLVRADYVPTLIFDEIDQGIGGRVGVVVGEKLWKLGLQHQVLCVTHLPQLAAFGDQHWRVSKQVKDARTTTTVTFLEGANRLGELAQMLGGLSESHRAAAEDTLRMASQRKNELVEQDHS